jgi:hypothetical protein
MVTATVWLMVPAGDQGCAEEELCQQVGLRNVRAMPGWNLNRLDPEPHAAIRRCQSGQIVRSSVATMYVEGISLVTAQK